MAIASVNRAQAVSIASATTVAAPATSHTTGNGLVVLVQFQPTAGTGVSIADTALNPYFEVGSILNGVGTNKVRMFRAYNITGHASNVVTATINSASTYRSITVYQFSGLDTSDPLGSAPNGSTGNSTAISSASVTVTAAEEVIVMFCEADNDTISNATYNLTNFAVTGDAVKYFADGYHIVTASEAATATCASGPWYIKAASFKAPAAATGQPTMRRWGGVSHIGGGSGGGRHGSGRMWGRTRSGIYVPNHLREAA